MILRILGRGQFELDDAAVAELNELDDQLIAAIEAGDEAAFESALRTLHDKVVQRGARVADDALVASELILPDVDATIEEVRSLMSDDGLIPG